jgi:hypothetical protein
VRLFLKITNAENCSGLARGRHYVVCTNPNFGEMLNFENRRLWPNLQFDSEGHFRKMIKQKKTKEGMKAYVRMYVHKKSSRRSKIKLRHSQRDQIEPNFAV